MSASRTNEFTGEADEEAVCAAAGVNERDQSTIPPAEGEHEREVDDRSRVSTSFTFMQY